MKFEKRFGKSWGKKVEVSYEKELQVSPKQMKIILLVIALIFLPLAGYFLLK